MRNYKASEFVMNNTDLLDEILSYFRSKYYKKCYECDQVCSYTKMRQEKKFVEWGSIPYVCCHECFRHNYLHSSLN